ncbi:DUF6632 domain-containing protein [Saccharomonospora sp. NPDC046836]|uniref:DUF6632 domain-containing protein n=1 Tax=Saccharomonospora sp. NPDC046836 TaxID=3156921 RepID=UPI0033E625A6
MNDHRGFTIFLRVYGAITVILFTLLFLGFMANTSLLAEQGGPLNWLIWNDVRFGDEHAHVPPMLLLIYVVWGAFLLRAARDPLAHRSFLDFTMWANAAHGVLMTFQAAMEIDRYWSKFLTDIPFVLLPVAVIYVWRSGAGRRQQSAATAGPG